VLVGVAAVIGGSLLGAVLIVATGSLRACGPETFFGLVGTEAGILGTVILWVRAVKRVPLATLGAPSRPLGDVVTGVVGGIILYVVAALVAVLVVELIKAVTGSEPTAPKQVTNCVSGIWFVLTGAGAAVLAPLGEETLFRGFIFQALRARFALWSAIVLDAILFDLIHIPFWLLMPSLLAVGCGLAFIYNRRQSLLASMTAHGVFNVIGILTIELDRLSHHR